MEKNESKPKVSSRRKPGSIHSFWTPVFTGVTALCLIVFPACRWKLRPTFPADRIAASLRHMCSTDYKLSVETRHESKSLQALVWKVALFKGQSRDLQGMTREGLDTLNHVLLCATRIALSTDAPLDFIEIKMADVLSGSTVTLWRYVPDIRDSMLQRIGDTEYFNRLVVEVDVDNKKALKGAAIPWDKPMTMSEFLAKQVILRARREGVETIEAHEDLSEPTTLGVIIDNWPSIEEEGPEHAARVTDIVHKSAETVIQGYRFNGFHGITLRDSQGVALNSWPL